MLSFSETSRSGPKLFAMAMLITSVLVTQPAPVVAADSLPPGAIAQLGAVRFANVGRVLALRFSPNGEFLAAASWDGDIRIWDTATWKELRQFTAHDGWIKSLAFATDSKRLLSAGKDGSVRIWDVANGTEIGRLQEPQGYFSFVLFAPDGKTLAGGATAGLQIKPQPIRFWDVLSGKEVGKLALEPLARPLGFSQDGKQFATVQWLQALGMTPQPQIHIWDWQTGKETQLPLPARRWFHNAVFAPDGRTMAISDDNRSLRLWDLRNNRELTPFPKLEDSDNCLSFSPDSRTLVSTGGGHTIHVWEVATSQERCRFRSPIQGEICSAISPDGRFLASGNVDTSVILWDLTGLRHQERAPAVVRPADVPVLWQELQSSDAALAYRALWRLASAGEPTISHVTKHLQPVRAANAASVGRLLIDLNDSQYAVREKAARELETLGEAVVPYLRDKLAAPLPSLEVRRRLERLLEKVAEITPLTMRAIEILERMNTPSAEGLLKSLAEGVREARLTQEARAALDRLNRLHKASR